jgi:lysyl-tRNA synthetase class 2
MSVCGSLIIEYHPNGPEGEAVRVDFTPPFRRVDMFVELQRLLTDVKLPAPDKLHTEEARMILDKACIQHKVDCPAPRTVARMIDKLVGDLIEPTCINPTFILNHPQVCLFLFICS